MLAMAWQEHIAYLAKTPVCAVRLSRLLGIVAQSRLKVPGLAQSLHKMSDL